MAKIRNLMRSQAAVLVSIGNSKYARKGSDDQFPKSLIMGKGMPQRNKKVVPPLLKE